LVAEDEDLQILGGVATDEQGEELDRATQRQVGELWQHLGRPPRWDQGTSQYRPMPPEPAGPATSPSFCTLRAFLPCSFWLVQALASTGRVDEAAQLFADLLDLANPLGLLPEEINPKNHGYLGNYPQALTHAALIQAALAIRDAHPD
jgi:GH15 family glucan-1,4-alpha-glucosidase